MSKIIHLIEIGGEFCTERTSTSLNEMKKRLRTNIQRNEKTIIDTKGVKLITPSYVDELIPPLMIEFGAEKTLNLIEFLPPLQGFLSEQVDRGYRARKPNK